MKDTFNHTRVILPDGTVTGPKDVTLFKDQVRFNQALSLFNSMSPVEKGKVIDLGCLEGGFAYLFAENGFDAEGVEVREQSVEKCEWLKAQNPDLKLKYVLNDVRSYLSELPDDYCDFCFNAGLMYHLDKPVEHINECARITKKAIFLDTHYAPTPEQETTYRFNPSEVMENEGVKGRWYVEHLSEKVEDHKEFELSSIGNRKSFWVNINEIPRMMRIAGFKHVYSSCQPTEKQCRMTFIGIK